MGDLGRGGDYYFFIEQSTSYQSHKDKYLVSESDWLCKASDFLFQNPKKVYKTCEKYNLYIVNVDMNLENHYL